MTRTVTVTRSGVLELVSRLKRVTMARLIELEGDPCGVASLLAKRYQGFTLSFADDGTVDYQQALQDITTGEIEVLTKLMNLPDDLLVVYEVVQPIAAFPEIIITSVVSRVDKDWLHEN